MSTPYTCAVLGCTHADLTGAQRVHGICSAPDCDQPIATWCAVCGIQVCSPLHGDRNTDGTFRCHQCRWGERDQPRPSSPPL